MKLVRRLLLLDFHGTLTQLKDPAAFLHKLKERGDVVAIWTGAPGNLPEKVVTAADAVAAKGYPSVTLIKELSDTHGRPSEVIVCDDDNSLGRAVVRAGAAFDIPIRYLPHTEIETLLGDPDNDR